MAETSRFALHRPELSASLRAGEEKILRLMRGTAREYAPRQLLIQGGTEHRFVYRLIEGWAARTRSLGDGRDQCILIFLPGDFFAVKSMFVRRHPDSVRMLSAAVAEQIDYRDLHEAFSTDADVACRCMGQVVEEERRLHNWVVSLGQGTADERVARLFIEFHGRLSVSRTIKPAALTFPMPLTQSQLSDHLGITAIHVNRVLRALREKGIVTVRDGEVTIHDLPRLTEIAEPLLDPYERRSPDYVEQPPPSDVRPEAPPIDRGGIPAASE
jgi:CRP/FNR family transcriptional regulator, anaerobic regulatory protein